MSFTLGELAVRFGCALKGSPDVRISRVATIEHADAESITFLANPRYRRHLAHTKAAAVVLEPKYADESPVAALLSPNPYATYARIASILYPPPAAPAGCHPTSSVDPAAKIDSSAAIGPHAVIEADVEIGPRVVVGPGCIVMRGARIGADTRLIASVTVYAGVAIGQRCILHAGTVIGSDGFGFAPDRGTWVKIPQVGGVRIGNDVEIGANCTIDRGAIEDTVIGDGVKLDNLVHIAHNVRVGAHTVMAGQSGIAGSTTVGQRCMIGGQVGIGGQLTICDDVAVTGKSFVSTSIRKPGLYSGSLTVDEAARFRKNAARFHHLDELVRRWRRVDADEEKGDAE
ncbi:MAG TPA: UDP-3-O-(3-hydroxymyristoyl)glucosamine N-acyltransferase [Steroidobacteraceae bacterium]